MNENNYLNISVSVSVILTSELNQLKKDNESFQTTNKELTKEKEILQNIILSKKYNQSEGLLTPFGDRRSRGRSPLSEANALTGR